MASRLTRLPTKPGQRHADGAPCTNLGWAKHYAKKHDKDPSNTQAEHLCYLHLLFHWTRDEPQEQFEVPIVVQQNDFFYNPAYPLAA